MLPVPRAQLLRAYLDPVREPAARRGPAPLSGRAVDRTAAPRAPRRVGGGEEPPPPVYGPRSTRQTLPAVPGQHFDVRM